MGPIRAAFLRPSAAPHRPYPHPHPHLYGHALAASSSSSSPSPSRELYDGDDDDRLKGLLPQEEEEEEEERGWKGGEEERAWRRRGVGGGKWKRSGHGVKWTGFGEEYKWKKERHDCDGGGGGGGGDDDKWKRGECKWRKDGDSKWKRDTKEFHWKNDSDVLKCRKEEEEEEEDPKWRKDDYKWKRDKASPLPCLSPLAKAEEPSTSRMALVFPFSDEEDEGGEGDVRTEAGEGETWPISDIVETEDEEGCPQPLGNGGEGTRGSPGAKEGAGDPGPSPGGSPDALEEPPPDPVASEPGPLLRPEDGAVPPPPPPPGDAQEEPGGEEETRGRGGVREEPEAESVDPPRDGIRATQRLRPRSYRQFLLTRERRSRVFLKARSYHLGRWFVSHFTHPYPSKDQKDQLAARTNMTRNQVSEWFGNMRRRIREATRGSGVCWEERVRLYNSVITGKSEPLPILPGDAINTWVPPVAQETPASESHEEVSASPKFKTTLLQRYLNGPPEAPPPPPSTYPPFRLDEEPQGRLGPSAPPPPEPPPPPPPPPGAFQESLPLCTSSPKESFQDLWSASFERVRDDRRRGRECLKRRGTTEVLDGWGFKRQKATEEEEEDWRPRASTSFLQDSPVGYLRLTPWPSRTTPADGGSSDEEGALHGGSRQPEEIAAAYTLMQLQHM